MLSQFVINLWLLLLLLVGSCSDVQLWDQGNARNQSGEYQPRIRRYFVAAENVQWDYAPSGENLIHREKGLGVWGEQTVYDKVRYVGYTDPSFTTRLEEEEHLGILGPIIRGVVGDTIEVVFKNNGDEPYSIHPHGVSYDRENEGANYSGSKFPGGAVAPGQTFTYTWEVPPSAGPAEDDVSSLVWLYHSHTNSVKNIYQGLIGAIIITAAEKATDEGKPVDIDKEFISLFMIVNENGPDEESEGHLMHSINGYIFGNQPGLVMSKGDRVRWYLLGMGTEVDIHTSHWHGTTVTHENRKTDVISLFPAIMTSADMLAENPSDRWLFHCHVTDHMTAGMISTYQVLP